MKYKIFICEDEHLELDFLKQTIEQHLGNNAEIMTADNGDSALNALMDFLPDLVLMDIHLGNWNGLDLSDRILEEHPNAKIIIITAYDQFNYAQKAIKTGVVDYLLKPIAPETLLGIVDKQISIYEEQQKKLIEQTKLKKNVDVLNEMFSISFMNDIINNQIQDIHLSILKNIFGEGCTASIYVIKGMLDDIVLNEDEAIILKKIIIDQLLKDKPSAQFYYDILHSDNIILCIFEPDSTSDNNLQTARNIRSYIISTLHIPVKIGISNPTKRISELPTAYRQALIALQIGNEIINVYDDYRDTLSVSASVYVKDHIDSIISLTLNKKNEELNDLLMDIQNQFEAVNLKLHECKTYIISLWINALSELGAKVTSPNLGIENIIVSPIMQFLDAQSISELISILKENLYTISDSVQSRITSTHNYVASRAKQYIDDHYTEKINLSIISSALNVSTYYLSHVFKSENKKNITEYITDKRLEKSCELLKTTDLSLVDISEKVGFNDTNYFYRIFKKKINITPKQYRNLNKQTM